MLTRASDGSPTSSATRTQALTLRVYAHALRGEEVDLSFAEFGGSERLYPAPTPEWDLFEAANPAERLVGPRGLEPRTVGLKAPSKRKT